MPALSLKKHSPTVTMEASHTNINNIKARIKETYIWLLLRRAKYLVKGNNRRRLPRFLSVLSFFERLEKKGCDYVVLRWFDQLPHVAAGEDIDILVRDKDAPYFDRLLTKSPLLSSSILCDVYNTTGHGGFAARGMAYYPPDVANGILDRAVKHESGAYVPCPQDHFMSLAYHALYHKGYKAGLPVSATHPPQKESPDHDYAEVLSQLADDIGLKIDINMADLDQYLSKKGWRPPIDTLDKLSKRNTWCGAVVQAELSDIDPVEGMATYVVRERASADQTLDHLKKILVENGFHILFECALSADQKIKATQKLRGGNWGTGPYSQSGGNPSNIIVVLDNAPQSPSGELAAQHHGIDNGRVFEVKNKMRSWFNDQNEKSQHCNIVHTSDNARHAMHYVREILPDQEGVIRAKADTAKSS